MLQQDEVTGLILCGGESRRMGADKAALLVGGETLLARTARLLSPLCAGLRLAPGSRSRYPELGLPEDLDATGGLGPLAGLAAGRAAATTDWLLALPCDLPRLTPAALEGLLSAAEQGDDVVAWSVRGFDEPLCVLVHRRALAALEAALAAGARKALAYWSGTRPDGAPLRVRRLDASPAVEAALVNANRPEDLSPAVRDSRREA